jgi:hypothetical protein
MALVGDAGFGPPPMDYRTDRPRRGLDKTLPVPDAVEEGPDQEVQKVQDEARERVEDNK